MMPQGPEFQDFLNHLTNNALESLKHAEGIARSYGSAYIGTEHLLLGVLSLNSSLGAKLLHDNGVTFEKAKAALEKTPRTMVLNMGTKGLSETAKLTLRAAYDVSQEFGQDFCGTEHIIYGILNQRSSRATSLLETMNLDVAALQNRLDQFLDRQQLGDNGKDEDLETVNAGTKRRGGGR